MSMLQPSPSTLFAAFVPSSVVIDDMFAFIQQPLRFLSQILLLWVSFMDLVVVVSSLNIVVAIWLDSVDANPGNGMLTLTYSIG
uniref:Uncharacterized protein n=1 Tax=Cucumis melo TaxID=3656 RepID=A0A9I9EJ83_CUCME